MLKSIASDFGFALNRIGPVKELVTVVVVEVVVVEFVDIVVTEAGEGLTGGRIADDDDEGF